MHSHQYIKYVELKGYKSIKNLTCDFLPGLNIIIGDNGSGKSNFFEFITYCFSQQYRDLNDFAAKIELRGSDGNQLLEANLAWESKPISPDASGSRGRTRDVIDNIDDIRMEKEISSLSFVKFSIPNDVAILGKELNIGYTIGGFNFNFDEKVGPFPIFLSGVFEFFLPASLRMRVTIDDSIFPLVEQHVNTAANRFKECLIQYSPIEDIRLSSAFRVAKISTDTYELRNIVFEYKINGDWFGWNGLSDGTKRVAYIIAQSVGEDSIAFGAPPYDVIVLLEEPEIGVHPHQLHRLLQFFREESGFRQIILSTHSPQVLDLLSSEELDRIIISEIVPERGTTFRHLTGDELRKAKYYLENESMLSDYWRFSDFQRSK